MKNLLILAVSVLSLSVFTPKANALDVVGGGAVITTVVAVGAFTTVMSPSVIGNKEVARLVVNDTQDYIQTGEISLFLENKISELQTTDSSLSTDDAVDILVAYSNELLK